jgi:pSer/pThr/pTyr-binding forkhead associated (FHA) protein
MPVAATIQPAILARGLRRVALERGVVIHEGTRVGSLVLPDGRRFPLGESPVVLGRASDCEVVLADPRSSRRHSQIQPVGHGFVISDLDSMNGTVVNGTPIREHPLSDGDEIRLGSTVLHFEAS